MCIRDSYTDQIEPYGMDECWLDVTGSGCMGTGFEIADEIRRTVKFEPVSYTHLDVYKRQIPKDAEKPVDGRMKTRNKQEENHGI